MTNLNERTEWFLVDVDDGIIDQANTKTGLLARNGFLRTSIEGYVRERPFYRIDRDDSDGVGGTLYVFSSKTQLIDAGFSWALEHKKTRKAR